MPNTQMINVNLIRPNPQQPRMYFDLAELKDLSQSIRENGLIQPITVEGPIKVGKKQDSYTLIAGERRLRATKLANIQEIECIVRQPEADNGQQNRALLALVENLQRSDLGPIDEAMAFQKLRDDYDLSNTTIALKLGISSAKVVTRLKLLKLDKPIQKSINEGKLIKDDRFVEALLAIPDDKARVKIAADLAERKANFKVAMQACERLTEHLAEEKIPETEVPATRWARIKKGEVNQPIYDVFTAAGKVPPWPLVEVVARDVCQRCELRAYASKTTCNGCTLVEFLQGMTGKVNQG